MECERPYYEPSPHRPLLFYIIFGVKEQELEVSRERHRVDGFPAGLAFRFYRRAADGAYMDALTGGAMGRVLDRQNHALYETLRASETWAVLRGEPEEDEDLRYLRNAVGFVQAALDGGGAGVLDVQTLTLYSPEDWETLIFAPDIEPILHTVILASPAEDGTVWLHTRGMRKFGRPDISMEGVGPREVSQAGLVINQMIYYGALGVIFHRPAKLHTTSGEAYIVDPTLVEDYDNPDFNNAYYRVFWIMCQPVDPEDGGGKSKFRFY